MSDPLAGTNTRNLLQHIISPKIVLGPTGGTYSVKTDLINVDNLAITGSFSQKFGIGRLGTVIMLLSGGSVEVICRSLKETSIILLTPQSQPLGTLWVTNEYTSAPPKFTIRSSRTDEIAAVSFFVIDGN